MDSVLRLRNRGADASLSTADGASCSLIRQEWPLRDMTTAGGGFSMCHMTGPSKAISTPAIRRELVEERCQEA